MHPHIYHTCYYIWLYGRCTYKYMIYIWTANVLVMIIRYTIALKHSKAMCKSSMITIMDFWGAFTHSSSQQPVEWDKTGRHLNKHLAQQLRCHFRNLHPILDCLGILPSLPNQPPANMHFRRQQVSVWVLSIYYSCGRPGSRLQPCPAPTVLEIWRVSQGS